MRIIGFHTFAAIALLLHTVPMPASAQQNGIHIALSGIYLRDSYGEFGPVEFESGTYGRVVALRPQYTRGVWQAAPEISVPVLKWLSLDFATTTNLGSTRKDEWQGGTQDEFGLPTEVPADLLVQTKARATLLSVSAQYRPIEALTLYGRGGALLTRNQIKVMESSADPDRFRESDTRAWFGAGARYVVYKGLTVSAEYGFAEDSFQSARLGLGWTFQPPRWID